jgi:signal transduction histidine kinase
VSFRRRLLFLFALTVLLSIAAVTVTIATLTRRAFDSANDEGTAKLVSEFHQEFENRRAEVIRRIQSVATLPETNRMLVSAAQPAREYGSFLETAQTIAQAQSLDFLEFVDDRGTIISSAQWPAKFGYHEPLATTTPPGTAFLKEEELPSGAVLGLFAVGEASTLDRKLYVIGGIRLDRSFLARLSPPQGMSVMLYEGSGSGRFSPDRLVSAPNPVAGPDEVAPVVEELNQDQRELKRIIHTPSGDQTLYAFPLSGLRGPSQEVPGVLLVTSSREIYSQLSREIRTAALVGASAGLILAMLFSGWASARVTRPVEDLARAAHEVAAGNWDASAKVDSRDELGELAASFNRMTRQLIDHEQLLVQAERVAAWRDLARRLAHELKNPLFPLQLTVENLIRAREHSPDEFDETFRESTATLLSEISSLKTIVARFSDFSRMPQPQFRRVNINELLDEIAKFYRPQLREANIHSRVEVNARTTIAADPDLLHRALSNLVLNAIDAMPEGGTLSLAAGAFDDGVRIEVADSGKGMTAEESAQLFTPYYTTKSEGTGLGLAIVQSIVTDHGGRIRVLSEPGRGTAFIIELPANRDKLNQAQGRSV